ncbi:MAG: hypothetical protein RLZZ385_2462 [Pseudomonadota bacterium]|jgi:limonene-1,2-epoxide hydrolase
MTVIQNTTHPTGDADVQSLLARVIAAYEQLGPDNLDAVQTLYTDDIYFEDPAHGIQGISALMHYFRVLFANVERCQFRFHQAIPMGTDIFLSWTMLVQHRKLRGGDLIRVEGVSFLKTRDGRVYFHRDYFDMGAMVYENVPLLGPIVRAIKHRLGQ